MKKDTLKYIPHSKLPAFMKNGLILEVSESGLISNIPSMENGVEPNSFGLDLSQYVLNHYHPDAAHDENVVQAFYEDCIEELLTKGGRIPHCSVKDWLYYRNMVNEIVID